MDPCESHRPYLAALADGEAELVPAATRAHVGGCAECGRELAAHGQLGEMLRASLRDTHDRPVAAVVRRRHRLIGFIAVAAAAVLALVATIVTVRTLRGSADPVAAAVTAEHRSPILQTSDPNAIATWCATNSDRRPPVVTLHSLVPSGARMDTAAGRSIVTIFYRATSGETITISWLDADSSPLTETQATAQSVDGQIVLVLHGAAGTAVIGGDAPVALLWSTAGDLEAAVES